MSTLINLDLVDKPEVLAEITSLFHDYEHALMTNNVDALNGYFWNDSRTTRYGIADRQLGIAALKAYRAATPPPDFTRTLHNLRITSYGDNVAVAQVEFIRTDTTLRGFQTQTWVKMAEGWKIVSAHVSMIPFVE